MPRPESIEPLSIRVERGALPTLADFDHEDYAIDERTALSFSGGETEGLERLHYYIWESENISTYKETRNGLLGGDYSSKLSPWLAQGCLSPKTIYYEVKAFETAKGANESTYWILFELLWRDFFRFMGKKHGNAIFKKGGTKGEIDSNWHDDFDLLQSWINGETGVPFIDANMRELKHTGFMSNRGRQNVASFLVKDLHVNWQLGADYFESVLIDYDVCTNYGNWNYIAGVGSDPRENRYFNILSQAKRYDPHGKYVRLWLPELAEIPENKIHRPDCLSASEQSSFHIQLGDDYPIALVDMAKWN